MSFAEPLLDRARLVLDGARAKGLKIATAESCTGGLIAGLLTEIAGSSDVVERGWVTYSNDAKIAEIGVPKALVVEHGAVSEPVARAMAEGALAAAPVDLAVAVTGVAGPGGGSAAKPVGLVHVALAAKGHPTVHRECRFGAIGRGAVRIETVKAALDMVHKALDRW
jgi:nicotinamide-nucleotide amidase